MDSLVSFDTSRWLSTLDLGTHAEETIRPCGRRLDLLLGRDGFALEIASGTGQHVQWFAQHLPGWSWQPTELHRGALYNIEVRVADAALDNVHEAIQLDVRTRSDVQNGKSTRIINRFDHFIGSVASKCATGKASSRQITVINPDSAKVLRNRNA